MVQDENLSGGQAAAEFCKSALNVTAVLAEHEITNVTAVLAEHEITSFGRRCGSGLSFRTNPADDVEEKYTDKIQYELNGGFFLVRIATISSWISVT